MAADHNALGTFLRARREQLTPEMVGVPDFGRRRVPGLRREEIAHLAGVSATYYARLEQGRDRRPSAEVVDAIARALRLDDQAVRHLHRLATPVPAPPRPAERPAHVRPELARLLERHVDAPAVVLGHALDVLASNAIARALHFSYTPGRNIVRDAFLVQDARNLYRPGDLDAILREGVALLQAAVVVDADDGRLAALVGELSIKSQAFRRLWARRDIREKSAGVKHFVHPLVGELTLDYDSFTIGGSDRQTLLICHAAPGGSSARALALLGSIAAGS
jgi:transcriptional regulator with XRE-family HTH domain